jgi:type IV secretory pathway VirD2 relaxase
VIVKAHVVRLTAGGAKAAALHLRYIERDGVEKDGSPGALYGPDGPVPADVFRQPRLDEKHQFRLIISPEDGHELDLTAYVRGLMTHVEGDLGPKVEWAAVNHYDTAHPHAHLVVRGVDRAGRELRLDREYISNGLRFRAQELATQELGPRLDVDVRRAHEKEITEERFTSLDRELERRADAGRVQARSNAPRGRIDESTLVARLEHLEGLRLAERVGPSVWTLTEGWQGELRELGARGDVLKQIHMAVSGDPSRYRIVRSGQSLDADQPGEAPPRVGRVAGKGLSDELKGVYYAVLETPAGMAYHVLLNRQSAEELRVGEVVAFRSRPEPSVRPIDREIAEVVERRGGVYALEPRTDLAASPHARRLRELERMNLATRQLPDRWRVSPNLLQELEKRGAEAPARHRVAFRKEPLSLEEQVNHRGSSTLDQVKVDLLAPYGFGADLRRAVDRRRDFVRRLGIEPDDPKRLTKLRALEEQTVGKGIATRSGQVFMEKAPEGFRGRVQVIDGPQPGAAFVAVSDGSRFVLLRATEPLRAAQGKTVTLHRERDGRLLFRAAPERDWDLGR